MYSGCYDNKYKTLTPCDQNTGCVKPVGSYCCCGYLQNGWGKDINSSPCSSGSRGKCPCSNRCCMPKPIPPRPAKQKCSCDCGGGLLKIKFEGIL